MWNFQLKWQFCRLKQVEKALQIGSEIKETLNKMFITILRLRSGYRRSRAHQRLSFESFSLFPVLTFSTNANHAFLLNAL